MRRLLSVLIFLVLGVISAQAAPKLGGYTTTTLSPGHGLQVEYLANDGTNYLWYPGNKVVLPGNWKVEGANICFRYGANSYNPVTGQQGGAFECMPLKLHPVSVFEQVKGDVFALRGRGAVPFRLPAEPMTIAQLLKRTKGPAPGSVAPGSDVMMEIESPIGSCKSIIADQNKSKADMINAAHLYFHGMLMGNKCVTVDYLKAFALLDKAGDTISRNAFLKILRQRAATGNPKAEMALKKLDAMGVK